MEHTNKVHLIGEISDDPMERTVGAGSKVASLSIVTRMGKSTTYHKCTAWDELANVASTMRKGDLVELLGYLKNESWVDKKTGEKKYATKVVALRLASVNPSKHRDEAADTAEDCGDVPF